jgi:uncharacterized protein
MKDLWIRGKRKLDAYISKPIDETTTQKFPLVIIAHGFNSSKENSTAKALMPFLKENRISSIAFSFSHHGNSEGKFEEVTISHMIEDLQTVINYASSLKWVSELAIVATSMAGIPAIISVAKDNTNQNKIKALCLRAGVSDFTTITRIKNANVEEWKTKGFVQYPSKLKGGPIKLNYSFYEDGITHDCYKVTPKISIPVLIVHGTADANVPIEQSEKLFSILKCEKEFFKVEGADHWLHSSEKDNNPKVFTKIANWLTKKLR